ncbi:hypothetical protein EV401DRAFT_2073172 [Pisolithus croceorrhizus]|nr:hypothetical protein EV401DRAFT_2073172 [Pisolithus croceorrhizus]
MDHIISPSSPSMPSHTTSGSSTTRLLQNLPRQQDYRPDHMHCGASSGHGSAIEQFQIPECVGPLANDIPLPLVGYPQSARRVQLPPENAVENGAIPMVSLSLNQAPTAVPMHRGTPWSSQHAQANHSISTTSTTCAVEDEWLSITEGQPAQLPRHTIPVPITRAQIPLHTDYFDIPLVNAVPPHFEGSAQDHASDNTAYPSVTLSSLNPSDMLSHAVGRPQGNGNVSRSGGPPFIQDATTGSTASRASRAIHCEYIAPGMSSWSAFPNPGTVPNRGPCPSGYLDHENFRAPLEWTESSDRFTGQRYPPSNALTELIFMISDRIFTRHALRPSSLTSNPISTQPESTSGDLTCIGIGIAVSKPTPTIASRDLFARLLLQHRKWKPSNTNIATKSRLSSH